MVSITNNIVEGLNYPFRDLKKLLSLGILYTLINLIVFLNIENSINISRKLAKIGGKSILVKIPHLSGYDIYVFIALFIISLIITLIIMGYQYNVIKFSIDKNSDLPGFNNILNMLIKGVKYLIVGLIYNILPLIVLIGGIELLHFQNSDYLVSIIALILFIICNLLFIMGLANMIDYDMFKKAFDLRDIINKISNLGWIRYVGIILFTYIIYAVIMGAVGMIFMILSILISISIKHPMAVVGIVSLIQGLFVTPYVSIFFSRVYGSVYRESIKE